MVADPVLNKKMREIMKCCPLFIFFISKFKKSRLPFLVFKINKKKR